LDGHLNIDAVFLVVDINGGVDNFLLFVELTEKRDNATFKIEMFLTVIPLIIEMEIYFTGQIGSVFE